MNTIHKPCLQYSNWSFSSLTPLLEGEHLDGKWYTAIFLGPTAGSTPIYWRIIKKIKSLFKTLVFIGT